MHGWFLACLQKKVLQPDWKGCFLMPTLNSICVWWSPRLLSVLRIIAAFLFMAHGTMKLFSFPAARASGQPELFSLSGVAGILEVFGGALLLIGLFTGRWRSFFRGRWHSPISSPMPLKDFDRF
jgi:hypothetical protein